MLEKLSEMSPKALIELASGYGIKIIEGVFIILIGFWIVGWVSRIVEKRLIKRNVGESLRDFLVPLIRINLKILVVFAAAETVGLKTTSFIAVLGGAALAIGMALQGSLSNFAGGILILFFKPFKVGDLIESQGYVGFVGKIEVFNTILKTGDNKRVVLPNGPVYNSPIVNYTDNGFLRVQVAVGIGYSENIKNAREVILEVVNKNPLIKKDMDINVHVSTLGESSVDLIVRCFTNTPDYWTVYYSLTEEIKIALDEHKIQIPFPQREILVKQEN